MDRIKKINDWIALKLTNMVSTMWCFYIFTALVTVPLFIKNAQVMSVSQYLSSSIIQLIMLPLLMVGQSIQGRAAETRSKKDHKMIQTELQLLKDQLQLLNEIHVKINDKSS